MDVHDDVCACVHVHGCVCSEKAAFQCSAVSCAVCRRGLQPPGASHFLVGASRPKNFEKKVPPTGAGGLGALAPRKFFLRPIWRAKNPCFWMLLWSHFSTGSAPGVTKASSKNVQKCVFSSAVSVTYASMLKKGLLGCLFECHTVIRVLFPLLLDTLLGKK